MDFDLEKTQRNVWQAKDRILFLENMAPLLNVEEDELDEIKEQLLERDFDYLEIASYAFGGAYEEPSATLVFDGKKDVYWDVFDIKNSNTIIKKITELAPQGDLLTHQRGLTQRDWRKRLEAMFGVDISTLTQPNPR